MGNINPIVAFLANTALDMIIGPQAGKSASGVPELAEIPCITGLRRKQGAVLLFIGARETGNTTEMLRIAEIIGWPTYGVFPEQAPPSWVTELNFKELDRKPPPFSTLILDDLGVRRGYLGKRDYFDPYVQVVEAMIPGVRHRRKLIMMFRAQTSKQADLSVADADIISFKPLNPAFFSTERTGILRLYKEADIEFKKMSEYQQLRHCYLVSRAWQGWARINPPGIQ